MDTIGIGMIGGGSISNAHLPALAALEGVRLVGIADVNAETGQRQAEKYGIAHAVTDYRDLLAMNDIQAVVVGVPAGLHAEIAMAAAEAGKHVLCEKPMARTLEECDAMIAAAQASGVVLQVAMVRRFDPEWGKIRAMVQAGKVGRPCLWRRIIAGSAPPPPYGAWYSDSRYSDGPLAESCAHDIDFLRYTFGDVKTVTASTWHMSDIGDVLDTCTVILDFVSGDQALVSWSWALPVGCRPGFSGLDVIGPKGAIHTPTPVAGSDYEIRIVHGGGEEEVISFTMDRSAPDMWFNGQDANFIAAVRGQATPRATGADGRAAQEIALAAFEATRSGKRVELAR